MVSDQPGPFGVLTAARVKSPSGAPNWWVVLARRNTRMLFKVVPAASCTPTVNGWLWAIVAGAEVITGRSATSTYQGSNRSTIRCTVPRWGFPPTRIARPVGSTHMLEWYWWAAEVGADASKRLLTGWYSCVVYTGLPCGSCPPASSTRPSNKVACDRYLVAVPRDGPAR